MRWMAAVLVAAMLFAATACVDGYPIGSSDGISLTDLIGPAGGKADKAGDPVSIALSGRVTFDRLIPTANGLDPTPVTMPARHVTIEVIQHDTLKEVLAKSETDANGDYTVAFETSEDFYVRARTQTLTGDDSVVHPGFYTTLKFTRLHSYAVSSMILHRDAPVQVVDLHADTSQPLLRAGAFAALDTIQRLREAAQPHFPDIGRVDVYWPERALYKSTVAESEREADPDKFINYRPQRILLLGGNWEDELNTDHDEFDETVIARAWVQLLQLAYSRHNGLPGRHDGENLVSNVAYNAGMGMAVGCALLGTDTYLNTYGFPGGVASFGREIDLDVGVLPGVGSGYHGEYPVAQVIWDLLDGSVDGPVDKDTDPVAIPMTDFFASFRALRTRSGTFEVAWLASLLQQLIDDGHLTIADADALMQMQGAKFPPAGDDPFPELVIGGAALTATLSAWEGIDPNPGLGPQANAMYVLRVPTEQKLNLRVDVTGNYKWWRNMVYIEAYSLDGTFFKEQKNKEPEKHRFTRRFPAGTYLVRVRHTPRSQQESRPTSFEIRVAPD